MSLRALALAGILGLLCVTGCNTNCRVEQHPAPSLKPPHVHVQRLWTETMWLGASIQDMLFGINYYCDMEHEFPSHLYD